MLAKLSSHLREHGYQERIVPVRYLADLQEEIEGRYRQGLLDQEFYREYLAEFAFDLPASLPEARSMIIVAVPQPQIQVTFTWEGEAMRCTLPPTYPERKMDNRVREIMERVLTPAGYGVAKAVLPKKLLAVRSGLAVYGKNNISYVPGMGSFYGLVVCFSDLSARDEDWRVPEMMDRCHNCCACLHSCPTGAITSERFLLHAERCIAFHNEKPGDVPFAAWIDPVWHNCLVGCLHCQRVCPENREVWQWVEEGAEFSEEETALLLEGTPLQQLPPAMLEKLEGAGLDGHVGVLPRNLKALLLQQRSQGSGS